MNMFDEARSVKGMMEMCKITQSEMAKKLGVSQSYVANKLRLLTLGKDEEERILTSGLSERHARALLRLSDEEDRRIALDKIIASSLTVRETEAIVDLMHDSRAPKLIGRKERAEGISVFIDVIKNSMTTLRSLGVQARETTSYHGNKMYITLSIEE